MPDDEKINRMKNMYEYIKENNVYKWAANIISEISILKNIKI
jgi:trehalose-6-phosphate synthase